MAIPNLRKIFASFRTKEDEAEFGRQALYNLIGTSLPDYRCTKQLPDIFVIGFIGSVVAFNFFLEKLRPTT